MAPLVCNSKSQFVLIIDDGPHRKRAELYLNRPDVLIISRRRSALESARQHGLRLVPNAETEHLIPYGPLGVLKDPGVPRCRYGRHLQTHVEVGSREKPGPRDVVRLDHGNSQYLHRVHVHVALIGQIEHLNQATVNRFF